MRKFLSLLVVLLTTFSSAWADSNLLSGKFSVSATKQVQFTKGNLYWSDKFFADGSDADHKLTVEGTSDLYALSTAEWNYLINSRTNASNLYKYGVTVGSATNCLIIAPDNYSGTIAASYTAEEWATAEAAGLVCLPAAGLRKGSNLSRGGAEGNYWSASQYLEDSAMGLGFEESFISDVDYERNFGISVRLVKTPYLCITAEEANSSVTFNWNSGSNVQYSTDGTTFNAYTAGTSVPLAKVGDKVYFKGTDVTTNVANHFTMSGKIAASGDVTSLTNGTGGDATLAESCYKQMFNGCTSLTTAPVLPATTLAEFCYNGMFIGTSLTAAPELPAPTLASGCYSFMFSGCTKLSKVTVNFTDWNTGGAATYNWLKDAGTDASVTSRTFICPEGLDVTTTRDESYVPEGWNVVNKQVSTEAELTAAISNAQAGEVIQLTADIDLTATISVASNTPAFTLDLNGHVLNAGNLAAPTTKGDKASVIYNEGTLNIIDSNPTAIHTQEGLTTVTGGVLTGGKGYYYSATMGGAIFNKNGGTLTMTKGTI